MPEPKTGGTPSAGKRRRLWQPWAFLLLGAALTGARWSGLRREDAHRHDLLQRAQAEAVADRVLRRTREIGHILAGAASYLEREPLPSRAEWRSYVDRLGLVNAREGIQGLSFVQWIPWEGLPAHLARVRREGFPDYQVLPGGDLPADPEGLSSIVLLEPMDERNQRAFARDMWADPVRREAMARARDSGHVALSGKLRLYQEGEADVQAGLVMYAPVYRRGLPLDSVAARRQALQGWATCVLRAGDFLDALLHEAHTRMDIDLYEGREAAPRAKLYDTDPSLALGRGGRLFEQRLDVAGRTWNLHIQQNPALAPGGAPPGRWEVLAGGLLISGLFAALWFAIGRDAHRTRALAERRSEALAAREAQFATLFREAPVGITVVDSATNRFLSVNPAFARMLGYTPEELEQRTFQSVSDPDAVEEDLAVVREVDSGAVDLADREKCYIHRDGRPIWARLRLVRLPEEPGLPRRRLALVEDISELKRSAAFTRSVLDAMPASVAVLDAEGRIQEVNRGWEAFAAANGAPEHGLGAGCSYLAAVPEAFHAVAAGIHDVIAGRRDRFVHEYECSSPDQERWFLMEVTPIRGHRGCLVAHIDVTEMKQAEAATRASEALFRSLFELSPDPITLSDLDTGHLLQVNPAWCDLVGIPREGALGRSSTELGTWEDPSEREAVIIELRRTGRVEARSATLRTARGETRPMMFTARLIDLLGRRCVLVMAKNLTGFLQAQEALRASEERFRLLAENAHDVVFRYRYLPEPGFEYVSPSIATLTGYTPEEFYQDHLLGLRLFHPEEQARLEQVIASRETVLSAKIRWIHTDGSLLWTDQMLRLERDNSGRVVTVQGAVRDVTSEVFIRKQLEEQVQRYTSLMETSLDAIHVIDAEGRLRYWNPAFLEHLGCEAEEAGGLTVEQWDRQWNAEELRRMIQELIDRPRRFETVHRRRDGTLRHVEINAAGVQYDGERMLLAAARDVTERVGVEQALRRSETRFRTLFKLLPVGVTLIDPEGRITLTNPASEALLGIPSNDLLRRDFKGPYWDIVRPDGTPMPPEEYASVRALQELRRIDNVEMGVRRPDGGTSWISVSAEPVIDAEMGAIIVYSDITARRQAEAALAESEARWDLALQGAGDGTWDWDAVRNTVWYSPQWKAMLGYAEAEIGDGLAEWDSRIHPEDREATLARVAAHLAGHTSHYTSEHRLRCKDGSWKWILDRGRVVARDPEGRPLRVVGTHSDITERKRIEAELWNSWERLRLLSDQLPDSFIYQYTVDPGSGPRFTYVSAGVERIAGVTAEEAVRDPGLLLGQIDPSQLPAYLAAEAASAATVTSFAIELRIRRADGVARWFRLRSTPRTQDDGSVAWEGIATDITEQMEGQIALAEAEARWKFALEGSGLAVWDWRADRDGILVNARYWELLGEPVSEGISFDDWLGRIHPEDLDRIRSLVEDFLEQRTLVYAPELRLRHRDGSYVWIQSRGMVVARDGSGRPSRIIGTHLDISGHKQVEEAQARFRQVVDQAADGIFIIDGEGRFLLCNAEACRSTGYSQEELLAMRVSDLDPGYTETTHRKLWLALEPGRPVKVTTLQRRKDGSTFPVEVHLGRLDMEGEPRVLGFVRDLTERKHAEAADLRAQKAESLVLMAGSIAHDFNNLFQALLASLDLAELKASGDPAVVAPLRNGREVLRRAVGLSWKMLDFSGRAIARLEPVDLGPLLAAWRPGLEDCLGGPRLDLALGEAPPVLADPGKLRQVLEALLVNAREAMDGAGRTQGRVRLSLAVDFQEDRPDRSTTGTWVADPPPGPATVCLEVADEGPGATPQVLARMFDPFFTTRDLGRGLGLPSALGLLQAHRAGLHVLLREGGGLAFRIHLPLVGS